MGSQVYAADRESFWVLLSPHRILLGSRCPINRTCAAPAEGAALGDFILQQSRGTTQAPSTPGYHQLDESRPQVSGKAGPDSQQDFL